MNRRQLISSDEAVPTAKQPTQPCSDCPWSRDSLPGWLGGVLPEDWIRIAHADGPESCHTLIGPQCAGLAIYRANVCKLPRDSRVLRLPADRGAVFKSPTEFLEHHGGDK